VYGNNFKFAGGTKVFKRVESEKEVKILNLICRVWMLSKQYGKMLSIHNQSCWMMHTMLTVAVRCWAGKWKVSQVVWVFYVNWMLPATPVQTSCGQQSFAFYSPTVWNSLPSALHYSLSLNTFFWAAINIIWHFCDFDATKVSWPTYLSTQWVEKVPYLTTNFEFLVELVRVEATSSL